ncbi:MAG: TMEM43 family protein [Synergistaceae bacterium]|nr:TMEM43 family protein [Synergistaceae bacterium]
MAYTKTETKSWFSRLKDSVTGVLVGIVLIIAGTWLLWWNEGDTFKTAGAIGEAELVTQEVQDISRINPELEGKVIHAVGFADTKDVVRDSLFGVEANAINIERKAEFYQWQEHQQRETRKKLGGGEETVTTYTYSLEWVSEPVDSNRFEDPSYQGRNTVLADVKSGTFRAQNVTFGAYKLPDFLTQRIGGAVPMTLENVDTASLSSAINSTDPSKLLLIHVQGSTVYIGKNPASPEVGDVRITFTKTPPADVSIVAQVIGDTFGPFTASNGYTFSRLEMGRVGSTKMFEDARSENNIMAWIFRAVGAIVVMLGLGLVMKPLSVVADVIPILGTIVGAGTGFVAFVIGLAWSLVVIAAAWLRFRPVVAGCLIAVAVGLLVLSYMRGRKKAQA